jgi:hypothetical protein
MIHRREAMLRLGQMGLGALTLPGLLAAEQAAAARSAPQVTATGRARSCILIFLWGGPPQQDLWDMKPEAPEGVRSLFKPIVTRVPGIDVCDQMPLLAQHTDKLAIVRSVTHASNEHEPSVYHMMTGRTNPQLRVPTNIRKRSDFPCVGSVVARVSEPQSIPATVTIPQAIGHDGITYAGTYAGFLGPRFDPLEFRGPPKTGEPPFALTPPAEVDAGRLQGRRGLLEQLEAHDRALQKAKTTEGLTGFYDQALRLVMSPQARGAFRIDTEPPAVVDRYGRNPYGECFLLSRRLVEAGVRLVTFNWVHTAKNGRTLNVWDNHGGTGDLGGLSGYDMLKADYCIPPLDRGLSALLDDLSLRGLLEETLVVVMGEFGRTPKINKTAGRDHWGACQSVLLAGGGIRGGQVHGATDRSAAYVKDSPVRPEDLLATIYWALGIAPDSEIHDRENRPHRLVEGQPLKLFG